MVHRLTDCFRYADYRHFWVGSMVAIGSFRMQDVVLGWQMLEATDSAFWVGLVAFAQGVPLLLWSPVTGVLADRLRRQDIIAVAVGMAGVASAGLAFLSAIGREQPWHILVTSFLVGSAFTLFGTTRLALLPNLVPAEMVVSSSSVEYSCTRLMGFVGPAVGGVLVEFLGVPSALAVQALLFGGAVLFFQATRGEAGRRQTRGNRLGGLWSGFGEAIRFLRCDRPLLSLVMLGLVMVPFGMSYQKLMPVFARDVLGAGASTLGLMMGVSSLGAGVAGFGVAAWGESLRRGRALLLSSALFGVGLVLFAFTRQVSTALVLLGVLGLLVGVYLTLSNVLFQSRSPDKLRGRVISVWSTVWGVLPFASLAMGALAEWAGAATAVAACGTICAVFCVGMALSGSHLKGL